MEIFSNLIAAKFDKWRLGILIIAAIYFSGCIFYPNDWRFIDGVNLLIHEAGHLIFMFLGEFASIAGGTVLQILIPAIFAIYFFLNGQKFSGALVMFWLGQSFINISVYAADAQMMNLPLLGGDNVIHDWNYMLSRLGMLSSATTISGAIWGFGAIIIIAAAIIGFINSRDLPENKIDYYK